jgi:hypothetical protein
MHGKDVEIEAKTIKVELTESHESFDSNENYVVTKN